MGIRCTRAIVGIAVALAFSLLSMAQRPKLRKKPRNSGRGNTMAATESLAQVDPRTSMI
jgi:hypothetical protein